MAYESWSVVKENRGIPMKIGVYSARLSSNTTGYSTERFNSIRYAFDFAAANRWNTPNVALADNINPFKDFTYTDAKGIVKKVEDTPNIVFKNGSNISFDNKKIGGITLDYYENMARLGSSNNLTLVKYTSDNGRGGFSKDWLNNMASNNQLSGEVASNIYKIQISTTINSLYQAAPNTFQNFYIINEIYSHNEHYTNNFKGKYMADGKPLIEEFPLKVYFGLTYDKSRREFENQTISHNNIAKHMFQVAYDNLPQSLKNTKCLYTGDFIMGNVFRDNVDRYHSISSSLNNGAKIHGIGMQLHLETITAGTLETIESDMLYVRNKGFDIGVMEFDADETNETNLRRLIRISLNMGVKFFNLCDIRLESDGFITKINFFNSNHQPTKYYNWVLEELKTYNVSTYGSKIKIY